MKALISFLTFLTCSLCCYSQSSVTGAQQKVAAQRATFNDIISIGELIKIVKEGNVGIKKIAERSGYAFRGRYHDPELNDFYYEESTIRIVWWRQTAVRLNMVRDGNAYGFTFYIK